MTAIHRRPLELAAAAIDFELSPADRAELAGHLTDCAVCRRRVEGIRRDAAAIQGLPVITFSRAHVERLRATAVARRSRASIGTLRLVALAALLALLALASLAVGASLLDRRPIDLAVQPSASPGTATPPPSPSPREGSQEPTPPASPAPEPVAWEPPEPVCPAPAEAVAAPVVGVALDGVDAAAIRTAETVMTCSTVAPSDFGQLEPSVPVAARSGDPLVFSVDTGWEIMHWEGFDRARDDEAVNVIAGGTPADGATTIEVPVPTRTGDVILGIDLDVRTTDGRVVATVSTALWVQVGSIAAPALRIVPADTACESIAWPEGIPQYGSITWRLSPTATEFATAESDTGAQLTTEWADGFAIGSASEGTIVDADGAVVARDGEGVTLDAGPGTEAGGYPLCVTPGNVSVLVQRAGG